MSKIGIAFSGGPNPAEIVDLAVLAESLGYESAWVAEGHGGDQFATLSGCAMRTSTIQLGTAITSIYVRSIPTIAMAAASVDDLSEGRFILGIGSSHKVQVEPEHGVPYSKPLTKTRESVEIIRNLLRDGAVQYDGESVKIENFDLWFTPRRADLPIYVAAVFPKMTALCGEVADGIILTRSTLKTGAWVKEKIAEGAKQAGRDPTQVAITSLLPTSIADTRAEALDAMRPGLAFYAGFFPRYNKLIAEHGFADEAAAIAEAWARDDRKAAIGLVTDAMVDATGVAGTPEECRARIEEYRESGIDLPIISPFARGPGAKATFEAAIRACAPR
ncbi:MAG: LLM class flavin-dependent oxidoreductase [Alphaproteobacteria bacterium]|nr:LLM class flavin-dependent oxidoreductase [Alphaproteobacteria bacterium]